MLADSHCHLNLIDLELFDGKVENVINNAIEAGVDYFLSVAVDLDDHLLLLEYAGQFPTVWISAGLHPNTEVPHEPKIGTLIEQGSDDNVVAIGETGLDYYRSSGDLKWQQQRFCNHISAAKELNKPLIIHSRNAKDDTIKILKKENAKEVGGVMHCFAEDLDMAQRAIDLGFYISFSGIVTFKNAKELQRVAKELPAERILVETDCPYLAPVPFRGKPNQPAYVKHVAEYIANLKGIDFKEFADQTTANFFELFKLNHNHV